MTRIYEGSRPDGTPVFGISNIGFIAGLGSGGNSRINAISALDGKAFVRLIGTPLPPGAGVSGAVPPSGVERRSPSQGGRAGTNTVRRRGAAADAPRAQRGPASEPDRTSTIEHS